MKIRAYYFASALAGMFVSFATSLATAAPHDAPASNLKAREGLKPFEYVESPTALPNYLVGEKWGTQGQPLRTMQKPLPPEESMRHFATLPGFETSLFAAEPDITKPIALAWDERGRLWIAETIDYPNELQKPGEGRDRIKICEDTNGDGKADKFTVFAEQLSIPTSLVFANGGVIVAQAPDMLFLKDTNGDGKADERRVLFTGWGTRDTHAGPSNLRYGFDNWIWGVVGYSGFDGTVGGKHHKFGMGFFRFKPDGSALEFIRSSNNNTWGLGLSEDHIVFGSTANNNASMYMPIPNRYYEAVNGWSASRLETIADSQNFYPITEKVRQVDAHGRYTAGAGAALYTARSFPKEYWNRVKFVTEPTGHLIGKFHLEPRGADFIAHNGKNFAASDDEWAGPIAAEVGPDGALWVIDWYNYIIQHNPTPHGFKTGKGNAYDTPLRDKHHGRIYRVAWNEVRAASAAQTLKTLARATPLELVAALKSDNLFWRMHAQRLLVERGKADVAPELAALARDRSTDEIGLNTAAIHALWTLRDLGAMDEPDSVGFAAAVGALEHPSAGVRKAAVDVLPRRAESAGPLHMGCRWDDGNPQVRLAVLLALAEMPGSELSALAAWKKLHDNGSDKWLRHAAIALAARNDASFLPRALTTSTPRVAEMAEAVSIVASHYASSGPVDSILQMLGVLKDSVSAEVSSALLDGLVGGWPQNKVPMLNEAEQFTLRSVMQSLPGSARSRLLALAQRWGREDIFRDQIPPILDALRDKLANGQTSDNERVAAARRLVSLDDSEATARLVLRHVTLLSPPSLAAGLVNALAEGRHARAAEALIGHWAQFTPTSRRAAVNVLSRRPDWTAALLDAIEAGRVKKIDLAAEHWSQLQQNPDRQLSARAAALVARKGPLHSSGSSGTSADREEMLKKLLPLAKERGNPARGREVYAANCANCHAIAGVGGRIGPDLTGISARERTDILVEILDPNRSVEANYRQWNLTTTDGSLLSGRLEAETQTSVEILDLTGAKHVVQRQKLKSLEASELSIMPAGFENLPAEDLKGLLEFLAQPVQTALQ